MAAHKLVFDFTPALGVAGQPIPLTFGSLYGWSESWYDATNLTDAASLDVGTNYVATRRGLLTSGWRIRRFRTFGFPFTRAGGKRNVAPADGVGTWPAPAGGALADEQPYDTVVINCVANNGRQRAFGMRGIGVDVISAGGLFLNPPPWAARLDGWATFLNPEFDIRYQTSIPTVPILNAELANVGTLEGSPSRPLIIIRRTVTNYLDPANTSIRISGILGFSGLNGNWTVIGQDNTFTIAPLLYTVLQLKPKRGRTVQGTYVGAGTLQGLVYDLSRVATVSTGDGGSPRTGSPGSRPRGRRSRRQP